MDQLREQVREFIRSLSDEQLVTYIITGVDTYEPAAVNFAKVELIRRNVDPDTLAKLTAEQTNFGSENRASKEEAAGQPFEIFRRVNRGQKSQMTNDQ
jgi:hypothetical protein